MVTRRRTAEVGGIGRGPKMQGPAVPTLSPSSTEQSSRTAGGLLLLLGGEVAASLDLPCRNQHRPPGRHRDDDDRTRGLSPSTRHATVPDQPTVW